MWLVLLHLAVLMLVGVVVVLLLLVLLVLLVVVVMVVDAVVHHRAQAGRTAPSSIPSPSSSSHRIMPLPAVFAAAMHPPNRRRAVYPLDLEPPRRTGRAFSSCSSSTTSSCSSSCSWSI